MKSSKKSKRYYYKSIDDCPISIWQKIAETGDVRLIEICDQLPEKAEFAHYLSVQTIHDEFYNYFGISDELRETIELQSKIATIEFDIEMGATGLIKNTLIRLKNELSLKNNNSKQRFSQQVVYLSQHFKFHLDINKLSIKEYNEYVNTYIEQQKTISQSIEHGKD